MTEIVVPYAFVPISEWAYIPDWAYKVSHDVPFEDGLSGAIDLELENFTELAVGGYGKKDKSEEAISAGSEVKWSKTPEGNLIIPGSSIKGMLRNVLDIASFGKFKQFVNRRHSYRELLSDTAYMKKYNDYVKGGISAAYLIRKSDGWYIRKCSCARIYNNDLNKALFNGQAVIENCDPKKGKNNDKRGKAVKQQNAKEKYENSIKNNVMVFTTSYEANIYSVNVKNGIPQQALIITDKGEQGKPRGENSNPLKNKVQGYVVYCNYRITKESDSKDILKKDYSYFYYDISKNEEKVDDAVVENFRQSQEKELVEYLFKSCKCKEGIPVWAFSAGRRVCELGICRMPRLAHSFSLEEIVKRQQKYFQKDHLFDLSDIMFGSIYPNNEIKVNMSLKSRVCCSDFISQSTDCQLNYPIKLCLQGPKTSFYRAYLAPSGEFSSSNAKLAGWKRYKVLERLVNPDMDNLPKDSQVSSIYFAKPHSKFKGTIVFHNLKKVELGALLWTIKFKQEQDCFHSLGHGKPYGAGAVKFTKIALRFPSYENQVCDDVASYITSFEQHMEENYPSQGKDITWIDSPQIQSLMKIAQKHIVPRRIYNELNDFDKIRSYLGYPDLPDNCNLDLLSKVDDSNLQLPMEFIHDKLKVSKADIGEDKYNSWEKERKNNLLSTLGLQPEEIELSNVLDDLKSKIDEAFKGSPYDSNAPCLNSYTSLKVDSIRKNFSEQLKNIAKLNPVLVEKFIDVYSYSGLMPAITEVNKNLKKKKKDEAQRRQDLKGAFEELKKNHSK